MGRAKSSFRFFRYLLQKNPNALFGPPNIETFGPRERKLGVGGRGQEKMGGICSEGGGNLPSPLAFLVGVSKLPRSFLS